MNNKKTIIENTQKRFNAELHTEEYRNVHSNPGHLEALINMVTIEKGKQYLDVGTGNGYIAFELAQRYPEISVSGLDIAENAIKKNRSIGIEKNIKNLDFISYEGIDMPFANDSILGIISRYTIHHFPDIDFSVKEFRRILEPNGFVIISDPITHDNDTSGFVDKFQKLKEDGHVHFYLANELIEIFSREGFVLSDKFYSQITYDRDMTPEYHTLFSDSSQDNLDNYQIQIDTSVVHITVTVMNSKFIKTDL